MTPARLPESYEERLREKFELIRDQALDALDMLDAQAAGRDDSAIATPASDRSAARA